MEVGDRIRIVNYGHKLLFSRDKNRNMDRERFAKNFPLIDEDDTFYYYDLRPELVGQEGEIANKIPHGMLTKYSVQFDSGNRVSWFSDNQLEKI